MVRYPRTAVEHMPCCLLALWCMASVLKRILLERFKAGDVVEFNIDGVHQRRQHPSPAHRALLYVQHASSMSGVVHAVLRSLVPHSMLGTG